MKKLFLFICVALSLNSIGQTDSSKLKLSAVVQARDLEIALYFITFGDKRLDDLDSVLLTKFRPPAVAPTGNTNVTVDGIEARIWLHLWRIFSSHLVIVDGGSADRLSVALKAAGHSWLTNKITREETERDDAWTGFRIIGRQYGKKEKTAFDQ